ncbi:DUF2179 domain-containing protein [Dethiosulfovibrio salsuginis]|uniref:Uncharacterized protein YebE, UPF0316 family n=1 Tax=Dethiosulfovibrio salsuginis TaxID=561720 RepID=A0A1X7KNX7_9BACT|nr:DUF5698 domain-containing protein [Dethiosulfovibrio salsuginis]SMG42470.1 Uncharacterized protein YebE, UPF0316 family [Dethiosulfovibrio salsuginis]
MVDIPSLISMLLIFCARVTDVSLGTFRILQLVRGRRMAAALIGFFEVMLYMVVLGHILGGGRVLRPLELIAYCLGYATGNYVGSYLEDRLMKGYTLVEAMAPCDEHSLEVIKKLREGGFGTTVIQGEGKTGPRYVIKIICNRKDIPEINRILDNIAFVSVFDVKSCFGGYFRMKRK